ncbi:UNVERIFIED_CONTAM: hypothetical protein Sradi_6318300 [Sesamum radiatum]|uniref:Uncharacterized protein n=1 Tax=Sesamum radiatum TaxID=300843 RepID=A0AAW2KC95_SESRA
MGSHSRVKNSRVQKISTMAEKKREVIEIGDSCPSPDKKGTPLRPIFCLKNRDDIKKFEEQEDCFILEFDPYDDLEVLKLSFPKDCDDAEVDVRVVAEKGQVISQFRSFFSMRLSFPSIAVLRDSQWVFYAQFS